MSEPSTPFNEVQSVVDSLRKDLDVERKRTERLDNLLLTNANLRKKLQQDLHESRQRCDMLTVEVEGLKGSTAADTAKSAAEANSYKQLYFKSLEEITHSRNQYLEQASLVATLSDERDALQLRLTEQGEQLNQYSPARLRRARQHGANIAEVEEERVLKERYVSLADVDANNWLTGGPPEREDDHVEHDLDDCDTISLAKLDPHELQRIVVGLYRRLKACEVVLRETNDARLDLSAKHVDQQREIEHMQRKLAIRSPLVIRREAAAGPYCPTCAARKNERTSSAPRRVPTTVQGGASRPTSATRPVSNSRPVSATRTVSAPKRTATGGVRSATASRPVSQATSARSHSGYSNTSMGGVRGPTLTNVPLPGRDVTRRKSPYQVREEQRVHATQNRNRSPMLRNMGPAPAANAPPARRGSSDEDAAAAPSGGTAVAAPVRLVPKSSNCYSEEPPVISRRT